MATTTLSSSDAHPKLRSQLRSSIASATSAPATPESFDATHVTSSSVNSRGTVSGTSHTHRRLRTQGFPRGDLHVRVLLPEDICNRSPGFSALIIREEIPSLLPVGCPTDDLAELTRKHCVVIAPRYSVVLLDASGSPALLGSPFRLGVSYQTRVQTSLPKVHVPGDPCPDLPGPADTQRLCEYGVGKDEGYIGVPNP